MLRQRELIDIIHRSIAEWSLSKAVKSNESNRLRSGKWILCFAKRLREHYQGCPSIKVFSIPYQDNINTTFKAKLKEYLFDIHVCKTSKYASRKHRDRPIQIVSKSLIAVESEFSTDTHDAAVDLCKLLCCNSKVKIFIGPNKIAASNIDGIYFPAIEEIANHNETGSLYVALIPIPGEISDGFKSWRLYKLAKNKLKEIFRFDESQNAFFDDSLGRPYNRGWTLSLDHIGSIREIATKNRKRQPSHWKPYVEKKRKPRVSGK